MSRDLDQRWGKEEYSTTPWGTMPCVSTFPCQDHCEDSCGRLKAKMYRKQQHKELRWAIRECFDEKEHYGKVKVGIIRWPASQHLS